MRAVVDKLGLRFGRLVVLSRAENHRNGAIRWLCRCDCGKEILIQSSNLTRKKYTRSCGCYRVGTTSLNGRKHGLTGTAEYTMLGRVKHRAKKRGLAFNLDVEDIKIPAHCPVLGIPLRASDLISSDNSPSLDRFDSSLGYVKGNVLVISKRANAIKSNATADELEIIAKWMRSEAKRKQLCVPI